MWHVTYFNHLQSCSIQLYTWLHEYPRAQPPHSRIFRFSAGTDGFMVGRGSFSCRRSLVGILIYLYKIITYYVSLNHIFAVRHVLSCAPPLWYDFSSLFAIYLWWYLCEPSVIPWLCVRPAVWWFKRSSIVRIMAKRSADAKGSPKPKAMKTDSNASKLEPLHQLVDLAPIGEMSKSMLLNMAPYSLVDSPHEFQLKTKEMLKGVSSSVGWDVTAWENNIYSH